MTLRRLTVAAESWPMVDPLVITGHQFTASNLVLVTIEQAGVKGQGEGVGIYYTDETVASMMAQIETVRCHIESGCSREDLLTLLPAGGARNALDCALWDLEAKLQNTSIWALTGIPCNEVVTVNTVGIGSPQWMADKAKSMDSPVLKVKLDGNQPLEKITAVRDACPNASLVVDVNQGWTFEQLVELAPKFASLGISMIEQPLPRGQDDALLHYQSPIPLCADESCLDSTEFEDAACKYQMINIKLDKAGGLTEALRLAKLAKSRNMGLMVGNMPATSLAMAPGFVVAQLCDFVDLDGPVLLANDRQNGLSLEKGIVSGLTPALWG